MLDDHARQHPTLKSPQTVCSCWSRSVYRTSKRSPEPALWTLVPSLFAHHPHCRGRHDLALSVPAGVCDVSGVVDLIVAHTSLLRAAARRPQCVSLRTTGDTLSFDPLTGTVFPVALGRNLLAIPIARVVVPGIRPRTRYAIHASGVTVTKGFPAKTPSTMRRAARVELAEIRGAEAATLNQLC